MITGHFATALVAKTQDKEGSIWLFLVAAMGLDFLMITFVALGFEHLELGTQILPGLGSAITDMQYSHDLVPVVGWITLFALVAYVITRNLKTAAICAALVAGHELCDLITGYPHNFWGPESAQVGLQLWVTQPIIASFIEAGFGVVCVAIFIRFYEVDKMGKWVLYGMMGGVPLLLIPLVMR